MKILLCSAALALSSVWPVMATTIREGAALPDLKASAFDGTLPDMKGKVVLVDFWASWCGPCKQSFPELEKIQAAYKKRGVVILAVNEDEEPSDMQLFLKKNPVSFPVVRDHENKFITAVGVDSMPTSLVVDSSGHIRHIHTGFNGDATVTQLKAQLDELLTP
ncbi:MAG: TlpA disulfide reductase family protein [Lentisphaerota bacterium]